MNSYRDTPISCDLCSGGVDLDHLSVRGNRRWQRVPNDEVLLSTQEHNGVRFSQESGRTVQAGVKETVAVWVSVRDKSTGVSLSHKRDPGGLNERFQSLSRARVGSCAPDYDQWSLRPVQYVDRLSYLVGGSGWRADVPVLAGTVEGHIVNRNKLLLNVDRNSQMDRAAPSLVSNPEGCRYHVGDPARVCHHPGALCHRLRHPDLVDLLHRAPSQFKELGTSADG